MVSGLEKSLQSLFIQRQVEMIRNHRVENNEVKEEECTTQWGDNNMGMELSIAIIQMP